MKSKRGAGRKRLTLIKNVLLAVTLSPLTIAAADKIDFNTAEGYVQAQRKLHCSLEDGKEMTYVWHGRAYARVPGERDKHLFNLLGMNVRQCGTVTDQQRGIGYRLVSREIMLYLDPVTGAVLREWENPWTDAKVAVIHVANDPVNQRPSFGKTADGKTRAFKPRVINKTWFMNFEVPLFYTNPLGGDYQKYVGGTYHATEIFDFNGDIDELLDADRHTAYANIAWVRISRWLPWMEMGDRAGLLYFNAVGAKLKSWDELPELMKREIAANYPAYRHAPPVDDQRPNETSWTYMRKIIDKRGDKSDGKPGGH
ncbi:DUF1838 domain-containing protein [Exilibacterium tricleocarpae]|uniref:DUF1838 domain-containing protein n=1 Tax=Exilibacterium tricleocarpae TaxID=2591008 RepID=A0A545TVM4_9GAMM|nr:DUF1838 family protein [Exilibacterium tricleocarpae]TQV81252.1 DUF1838 domain-containing protein [Exilibacterium tricleocarpae]